MTTKKAPTAPKKTAAAKKAAEPIVITSIKGFDTNLACRGYQFVIGKTFTHEGTVRACGSGFHACTTEAHPFEVFGFYAPAGSRYCEVVQGGETHSDDSIKIASATITIGIELTIGELVKRAWDYVWSRATLSDDAHVTSDYGAASSTGYYGAASSTGTRGAASSTGKASAAMASGFEGKAKASDGSAIFLVERSANYDIVNVAAFIAGRDGIKPDTFYRLVDGKPVEVA